MKMSLATWIFDCPCRNPKIKKKKGGEPPKDLDNFIIRKEDFGTLYYSKSKTPIFHESYFEETSRFDPQFILSSPIIAILEITGKCNLNCIHCYRPDSKGKRLELDVIKRLISELTDMNVVGVQYTGGEPFLHEDLPEMLKESKENGLKNEVISNGYKVNESIIEECSELIDELFISIDGKRETHNRIRQSPDCFDSTIKTLTEFSKRGVHTTVGMTLNKLNYSDVEEVYSVVSNCGAKEVFLKRMLPVGRGKRIIDLYLGSNVLPDLKDRVKMIVNDRTRITFGARCIDPIGEYTFFGCPGGRTQIVIDCDGNVYRCLYKKDQSLGNIHTTTFRDIWDKNNETLERCMCIYSDRCGGLCEL